MSPTSSFIIGTTTQLFQIQRHPFQKSELLYLKTVSNIQYHFFRTRTHHLTLSFITYFINPPLFSENHIQRFEVRKYLELPRALEYLQATFLRLPWVMAWHYYIHSNLKPSGESLTLNSARIPIFPSHFHSLGNSTPHSSQKHT